MYGHYAHELRKVSIELPRFAVLASVHRTATVSSFDPRKKVRIELQTVAVLWTLFKTAIYGCCAQVLSVPVGSSVQVQLRTEISLIITLFSQTLKAEEDKLP